MSFQGVETPSQIEHFDRRVQYKIHCTAFYSITTGTRKTGLIDNGFIGGVYSIVKLCKTGYQLFPG
jgi:hypothetical protein